MTRSRPAAGGGRTIDVHPERLDRWLTGFSERHGRPVVDVTPLVVHLRAPDGTTATCKVPFPPLQPLDGPYGGLAGHALTDRRVGVILVRLGGFSVGVFQGSALVISKTGSRQVHGRAAAGGTSQTRFARRREGQVRVSLDAAADTVAAVLLPEFQQLDAVVRGGDRQALDTVLSDKRLALLLPLLTGGVLDVPEPRRAVLDAAPSLFRAVQITVVP